MERTGGHGVAKLPQRLRCKINSGYTRALLSGHRGLPSPRLFTNLNQIHIVLPEEMDALPIQAGRDYCTLATCTPYGINTRRMLVRGKRIENIAGEVVVVSEAARRESRRLSDSGFHQCRSRVGDSLERTTARAEDFWKNFWKNPKIALTPRLLSATIVTHIGNVSDETSETISVVNPFMRKRDSGLQRKWRMGNSLILCLSLLPIFFSFR